MFCAAPGEFDGVSVPGERERGDVECVRGECKVDNAVVVAPGFEVVEDIVRGCVDEGVDAEVVVVCVDCEVGDMLEDGEEAELALPCWRAECARKAARKLERKGRWVGMLLIFWRLRAWVLG